MYVKSNLKTLLDEKSISIRELERRIGKLFPDDKSQHVKFETLRRLYNDDTKQYHRETIAKVCVALNISIDDLLILIRE
ncbi:hypothetical protein OPHB3_2452 [Oceanobacillus picturae]|uniref:HTH cro/C1-type domain-containing protein n=1 Tax=Oceanobacillus picturae TaxID=171693 RepID=A0A0U9H7P9_9BACI|nr:helix-turn-helix transcriptional regulator [Oceanobacillus picturae]GAQ18511.1 hypothetical protein OPHB3_2452 [Oceanobacillus picturae]